MAVFLTFKAQNATILKGRRSSAVKRRITVNLPPKLYRDLKAKAGRSGQTLSQLIKEAAWMVMREDAADMDIFRRRAKEPSRPISNVLRTLRGARIR